MFDTPKTCRTCAHRNGRMGFFPKCVKSGVYVETERNYPTVCGKDFSGWEKRESIFQLIKAWLVG